MNAPDDVFLKMTIPERVDYIKAFNAMEAALAMEPSSYERALALQNARKLVDRVRRLMDEAKLRPMPPADEEAP
jgi:hypothetical protein